jgi:hypothetical protein
MCNNHLFGSCKTLKASFVYDKYWVHMYDLLNKAVKDIQECISYNIWYSVQISDMSLMYVFLKLRAPAFPLV